jgi:hypothetical protein
MGKELLGLENHGSKSSQYSMMIFAYYSLPFFILCSAISDMDLLRIE